MGSVGSLVIAAWGTPHTTARAQEWNAPDALELARRGVERRQEAQADPSLGSYRARARGFVFFLAQVGEGLSGPPRLIKADQLAVEVYWLAPGRSKQVVVAWRDRQYLPTDIHYHRDHLGIVTNEFGDVIRIGEGDEVRDVPHPLSPAGLEAYDFALGDSLALRGPAGEIRVRELVVRPRSFREPRVVGALYLDAASARVVRFRFSFTPAAYLDRQLEDISVVLENALVEQRYWLPYRQEIEIRRRASWLDFPARGIIRGRWEIGDYEIGAAVPPAVLVGPEIGGLRTPRPTAADTVWDRPLSAAIAEVAQPVTEEDLRGVRDEIQRIAGARALSGLPGTRLATGSLSDLVHVNRVQGLALGAGGVIALGGSTVRLRPRIGVGTADGRVTGGLGVELGTGGTVLTAFGRREIRDFSDLPVISPLLNSILAQEGGDDHGDYVLLDRAGGGLRIPFGTRETVAVEIAAERSASLDVEASPARGTYRPNPPLGAGTYGVARLRLERAAAEVVPRGDLSGGVVVEAGEGPTTYARIAVDGRWLHPVGPTALLTRVYFGTGSDQMPAYRGFVLGGRGTLVGEPYRAYGGRRFALGRLEWRFHVPVPAIPLGSFASTGRTAVVAPYVAAGWADRPFAGLPWTASDGIRPVAGVAVEWLMRLLRIEAGVGLRDGDFGITIDVHPDWWGLL